MRDVTTKIGKRTAGGRLAACGAAAVLTLSACGSTSVPGPTAPPTVRPSVSIPVQTPGPGGLRSGLLSLADLPSGFVTRPLTARNLPTDLTGCPPLERLMTGALGRHEQAEFFRPPLGPWIDEAIIEPRGGKPEQIAGRLAKAIDGCDSVTVTEEGHRVLLRITSDPAPTPAPVVTPVGGRVTRSYRATGSLGGFGLRMDIVLGHAGSSIVLLTDTALASAMDPALTAQAARIALDRAARA